MMKFWFYRYELEPMSAVGSMSNAANRPGALLKVEWPNRKIGYADLFPWPELGDVDLDTQLIALKQGRLTKLVEQSIWLAKKDAVARSTGKNIFAGAAKVKNHYLLGDINKFNDNTLSNLKSAGFTTVKIKVGRNIEEEARFISKLVKQNALLVRLDFNAKVDLETYRKFMSYLDLTDRAKIEFVEDPVPWDLEAWKEAASFTQLAMDQEFEKVNWKEMPERPPFKVLVIKPARRDVEKDLELIEKYNLKAVVTSSIDHPVGVAHACNIASEIKKTFPSVLLDCGCLSLRVYKPSEFFIRVQTTGPFFSGVNGTGIGFDDLLQRVEWIPISEAPGKRK
jgi:O-succinylbenzoate synthase